MKRIIKKIYYIVLHYFPKSIAHKILYYRVLGKRLNLRNPKDFNEKIQWLMVYKYGEKEGKLADKFLVRNYVKNKGLSNLLCEIYGVYNNFNEIDFNCLPDEFVLKTNHGSGDVFICNDKKKFDFDKCSKVLQENLSKDYSKQSLEYHYHYIEPKIICEQYLKDSYRKNPLDYKFYCFNGKVECILLCSEREKELKLDYYDLNWNYLNYSKEEYRSNIKHEKPNNLIEMIEVAQKLSENFKFVRVDLYNINNKIYFGELTFTPAAGLVNYNTKEALDYFGSLINLED